MADDEKQWWKKHGQQVPPFDSEGEGVGQHHEDRREDIADDVETRRAELAEDIEGERVSTAQDLEDERKTKAEDLEELTLNRLRFIAYAAAAAASIAIAVAVVSLVQDHRIRDNSQSITEIRQLQKRVDADSKERRSDTCQSFEQQHRREVAQLASTYEYLLSLTPEERKTLLNRSIAAQVPLAEKEARSDQDNFGIFVPKYCDDPNVGLPEPDPTIPTRPKGLNPPRVPSPLP